MWNKSRTGVGLTVIAVGVAVGPVAAQDADAPDAREILDRASAFYRGLDGLTARATMTTHMTGIMGMDVTHEQGCQLAANKPNRYRVRYDDEQTGAMTFASDGTRATIYAQTTDMYIEDQSPATFAEAVKSLHGQMMMGEEVGFDATLMMPHAIVMLLLDENGMKVLADGVVAIEYVGEEQIGEHATQHIAIETADMDIGLWFATGETRWLVKMAPDMTKMLKKQMEEMAQFGDLEEMGIDLDDLPQMDIAVVYDQWQANPDFEAGAFATQMPETATRAESFMDLLGMDFEGQGAGGGMETDSDLLGNPAPVLELDLLDGGTMSLAQHKGKEIVVLDFWATWCPPCREGLPIVTEVTRKLADKGVVFYAVNLQEDERQVRAFLKEQKIDVTVAMDTKGVSNGPFGLTAIPQTVIIDKNGVVQAVHVGLLPNLEERLAEELETLIKGGSLIEPSPEKANKGIDKGLPMAMEQVWAVPGNWSGVDSRDGKVYATKGFSANGAVFASDGEKLRSFKTKGGKFGSTLRLANLDQDAALEFVSLSGWGEPVRAWDDDGTELWTYPRGDGVDDAWTGDVDGDGIDEIAIGFNGSTGIHLVNADGSTRWKDTRIANVWHVCIADTDGDGAKEIVTTSAGGQVHVFSAEGENTANLRAGLYANMVRVATTSAGDVIAVVGGDRDVVGIDFEGNQLFRARVPGVGGQAHIIAAEAAPDRPWFAVGFRGGPIAVIDVDAGSVIASYAASDVADLCWLATDDGPLLVYTTNSSLEARRLVVADVEAPVVNP